MDISALQGQKRTVSFGLEQAKTTSKTASKTTDAQASDDTTKAVAKQVQATKVTAMNLVSSGLTKVVLQDVWGHVTISQGLSEDTKASLAKLDAIRAYQGDSVNTSEAASAPTPAPAPAPTPTPSPAPTPSPTPTPAPTPAPAPSPSGPGNGNGNGNGHGNGNGKK